MQFKSVLKCYQCDIEAKKSDPLENLLKTKNSEAGVKFRAKLFLDWALSTRILMTL